MSDADPTAATPPPTVSHLPVVFPPGTSAGSRRRRLVFAAVYLAVAAALVWPVFPAVARAFPLVLGLPLSFAWVVGALVVGFAALVALYCGDLTDQRAAAGPPPRPAATGSPAEDR
jgi:hypothetical protein